MFYALISSGIHYMHYMHALDFHWGFFFPSFFLFFLVSATFCWILVR
jgi:hypothetical protein